LINDDCFFIAFDKPPSITSHDVVATFRAVTGIKKVGHTGTLDPFASGVLVLACRKATRLIQYLPTTRKIYQTRVQLGVETESGDIEGEIVRQMNVPSLSEQILSEVIQSFVGKSIQRPPKYSAIKYKGKRLYEYARAGIEVPLPSREITIHSIEQHQSTSDSLELTINCEKGTYIRSLGVDIAAQLETTGHLSQLRRLESDGVSIEQTLDYPTFSSLVANTDNWEMALDAKEKKNYPRNSREQVLEQIRPFQISPELLFSVYPKMHVDQQQAIDVGHGKSLLCDIDIQEDRTLIILHEKKLIAIAQKKGNFAKMHRVLI
jgi:tRNA pseudouridine55 synthase